MSDDATSTPLVGQTFRVVEIGGAPALDVPTAELTFGDDGRVTGRATINRVFGPYAIDGDRLTFGALGTTMMAGLPDAMDQEQRLLQILGAPLTIDAGAADGRITLLADGQPALVLEHARPRGLTPQYGFSQERRRGPYPGGMRWVLAVIVVMPAVLLVVGAVRGRVQVRSCCAVDAAHDKRMIAAEPGVRGDRAAS